jgi:hypothetical protein
MRRGVVREADSRCGEQNTTLTLAVVEVRYIYRTHLFRNSYLNVEIDI